MDHTCRRQHRLHHGHQLGAFFSDRARSGNKYHVVTGSKRREHLCCCPDHSSCPVALYRVADLFACGYPYTTKTRTVFSYVNHQCRVCVRFSAGVSPAEITVCIQGNRSGQCHENRLSESGGQRLSAFRPAAGKNLPAVSVRHSFSEAVLHLALTLFGLIRSFHPEPLQSFSAEKKAEIFFRIFEKGHTAPFILRLQIIYQKKGPCQ